MAKPLINRDRKWTLRLMMLATILVLVVVFVAENFVIVEVRLITRSVEARLAWVALIAGGIGVLAGLLLPRLWRRAGSADVVGSLKQPGSGQPESVTAPGE